MMFMNILIRLILIYSLLFHATTSFAIEDFEKLWGLVTYTGHFQDYTYQIEPQFRLVNRGNGYEQFLLNMGAGQPISPTLQFWLGQTLANFSPYNNATADVSANDVNEYRFWQQLFWTPSSKTLLRSRLEERYSFGNAPWAVRLRERFYWTIPLAEPHSLVLSNEFFINVKNAPWIVTPTIDQNRFFIGLLQQISSQVSLNISYMNQYIFRTPAEDNHAVVVNLFITMPE